MITWQWCKIDCGLTGRLDVPDLLALPGTMITEDVSTGVETPNQLT